jgi:hypothetical protein
VIYADSRRVLIVGAAERLTGFQEWRQKADNSSNALDVSI